jgi:Cys-tRNA(Pro) deacylase
MYAYEEHGGTARAASELGVEEHCVIKTLVFQTDAKKPFIVLMHGDREVSTKELARILGVKSVTPVDHAAAQRLTGYMVGGISPFGTKSQLPIFAESTIISLEKILINGGKRGFLVELSPNDLEKLISVTRITATQQ